MYARSLTDEERQVLRRSLKASNGFTVRRAQMLLLSAEEGLRCLHPKAKGNPTDRRALDDAAREQLRALIRRSPRDRGYETSLWTLALLAQAGDEGGITTWRVTGETIRATLAAMGIQWRRVKQRIHSPDPHYTVKKSGATG